MKTMAVTIQKGGTCKTTTASALAAGLALHGKNVLSIDLDPQGDLSFAFLARADVPSSMDVLYGQAKAEEAIQHTAQGDIIAAAPALSGADLKLASSCAGATKLKEALEPVKKNYDYIVIDTPPALGALTVNALSAADGVLIPAQANVFSLKAIKQLSATIDAVRNTTNPTLVISGILLCKYDRRPIIQRDNAAALKNEAERLHTKVFNSRIRNCTAIQEAQLLQQSIFSYAPRSHAADDYKNFVQEFLSDEKRGN